MENQSVFSVLSKINVNEKTEKKNGLTYLSWAWAWSELKKHYPQAQYTIYENIEGWNYFTDGRTGWVKTGVIVEDIEHIEYLPIMDYRNKSISIENITSFDVNKTIQRSLTKAIGRHGLGCYIYAGEDLPESVETKIDPPKAEPKKEPLTINKMIRESNLIDKINNCKTEQELKDLYNDNKDLVTKEMNPLFTAKKIELNGK